MFYLIISYRNYQEQKHQHCPTIHPVAPLTTGLLAPVKLVVQSGSPTSLLLSWLDPGLTGTHKKSDGRAYLVSVNVRSASGPCLVYVNLESAPGPCLVSVNIESASGPCLVRVNIEEGIRTLSGKCQCRKYIQTLPGNCQCEECIMILSGKCQVESAHPDLVCYVFEDISCHLHT